MTTYRATFDEFNAMVNGMVNREDREFLERKVEEFGKRVGGIGRRAYERARQHFDAYDFESIGRQVRSLRRKADTAFTADIVQRLLSIGEQQHARPRMQRWMMANPRLRKLAYKDRCHGFRDTYIDLEPGVWGEQHTDYMRVRTGMPVTTEAGHTHFVTYFDAYDANGDLELEFDQQLDIEETWDATDYALDQGRDDPSDPSNGSL